LDNGSLPVSEALVRIILLGCMLYLYNDFVSTTYVIWGRAIAEAVSRWLRNAAARVRLRVCQVGFVVDKVGSGQVFSEYFGFPCQKPFIPPTSPSSQLPGALITRPRSPADCPISSNRNGTESSRRRPRPKIGLQSHRKEYVIWNQIRQT
jgi:hypothetical protein